MPLLEGGGANRTSRTSSVRRRRSASAHERATARNRQPARRSQPTRKPSTPSQPRNQRRTGTYGGGGTSKRAPSSGGARGVSSNRAPGAISGISKSVPKPPSTKDYLAGDVTYQDLLRNQKRTLNDFLADIGRQRTEATTSFADVQRSMGLEKERALEAMMNEFASRGLLQSGLYAEEQGNYNRDWQSQMSQLEQGQNSLLADLLSQQTNFSREQQLAQEAARQDAIRRRAQKYGL